MNHLDAVSAHGDSTAQVKLQNCRIFGDVLKSTGCGLWGRGLSVFVSL